MRPALSALLSFLPEVNFYWYAIEIKELAQLVFQKALVGVFDVLGVIAEKGKSRIVRWQLGDVLDLDIRPLHKVGAAGFVDELPGDDRRILLRPADNMHFHPFHLVEGFGQRCVVIGKSAFEFRSGTETNDF